MFPAGVLFFFFLKARTTYAQEKQAKTKQHVKTQPTKQNKQHVPIFFFLLFFYQCTEYHHVYKLEAIDCSYLCCAGGGQEGDGENLAPHADRIWDMALTMLAVAAHGSK